MCYGSLLFKLWKNVAKNKCKKELTKINLDIQIIENVIIKYSIKNLINFYFILVLNDLDLKQDMLLTEYYLTDSSTDDKNFQRLLEERR